MQEVNNVWYFPNNLDVRTCPKNAMTSIKNFYISTIIKKTGINPAEEGKKHVHIRGGPYSWREKAVWNHADMFDFPFRKNSIRFCVKRDPIERFLSCVEYLQNEGLNYDEEKRHSARDYDKFYGSVNHVLTNLERGRLYNVHFMPQSWFMGKPSQYDMVYDISEVSLMYRDIYDIVGLDWQKKGIKDYHMNVSARRSKEEIKELSKDRTIVDRWRHDREVITDNITAHDKARIKKLYREDYANGWY